MGFGLTDIDNAVNYTLNLTRPLVHSGEVTTITIDLKMMKDFFVYSSHPDKSLSPSNIEWQDSSFFSAIGILKEPKPKIKYDPMFEMDIGYHTLQVQFKQDLQISDNINPGTYTLNGTFVYQACDPRKCIPHWDDFSVQLIIEEGDGKAGFIYPVQTEFISLDNKFGNASSVNDELDSIIQEGLFSFILFALGMGFLALLTPCVFPMIPITVAFFTKVGEKENSSPLFSALVYTVGIIIIFTSLGLILALTLGAAGANQLASNPWVNLFIAALFIYFAFLFLIGCSCSDEKPNFNKVEVLQMMHVGDKWTVTVPAELAYGPRSPSPVIPPNSILVFDMELMSIKPRGE